MSERLGLFRSPPARFPRPPTLSLVLAARVKAQQFASVLVVEETDRSENFRLRLDINRFRVDVSADRA